jgi:hypothetical protein
MHDEQYTTVTIVLRGAEHDLGAELDEVLPGVSLDEVMFWSAEAGITDHALAQGADPNLWHDGEDDQ